MKLRFEPVTAANRAQALTLAVQPAQAGFVETVEECLLQADAERGWRPVLIYAEDASAADTPNAMDTPNAARVADAHSASPCAPVGFAMYKYFGLCAPLGRAWLDRLLIDARFQGHGYGKAAVAALCTRLRAEYKCRSIYLSVYEDNLPAIRLYEHAGFAFTGKRDTKGEKIMVARR